MSCHAGVLAAAAIFVQNTVNSNTGRNQIQGLLAATHTSHNQRTTMLYKDKTIFGYWLFDLEPFSSLYHFAVYKKKYLISHTSVEVETQADKKACIPFEIQSLVKHCSLIPYILNLWLPYLWLITFILSFSQVLHCLDHRRHKDTKWLGSICSLQPPMWRKFSTEDSF